MELKCDFSHTPPAFSQSLDQALGIGVQSALHLSVIPTHMWVPFW